MIEGNKRISKKQNLSGFYRNLIIFISGDRIVVSCDVEAFVQDFVPSKDNNLTISTLKATHHNDTLNNKLDFNNMSTEEDFNDSEENMIDNSSSGGGGGGSSSSSSSSSDEHDDYDTASITVKTSTTTTTTTTTTPYPLLQAIQYHCRGEGLPGRTTRWSALAAPSCRGKWLRLTLDTPRKCSHAQFIFV